MNIEEYISSGTLELFVLGKLSPKEEAEVVALAEKHFELAEEITRIELGLEQYAELYKTSPTKSFKERMMADLRNQSQGKVIQLDDKLRRPNKLVQFVAIAASLLLLFSVGLNIYQQNKITESTNQLNELIAEKEVLASQSDKIRTQLNSAKEKINLFQNPDVKNVLIQGSALSPESYAYVSWNSKTKVAIVSGINLPKNPSDKQYQLWALIDGQPVDMGVFDSVEELATILVTEGIPSAFAVTLEDKGGKPTPNLEQLYLIGNV